MRYEITRHAAILAGGGSIMQETRHWHEDTGVTTSGPRKESDADDYRYFPEPDLVPVAPDPSLGRASCGPPCPSCRRCAAGGCSGRGASPTSRCATSSTPARSS